jgi:hypothetical protein
VINKARCTLCGKDYQVIACGAKTKSRLKKNEKKAGEYICQYCKKKGTGEYINTHANHQQHNVYFNEDMED